MASLTWRDLIDIRTVLRRYEMDVVEQLGRPPADSKTVRIGPRPIRILIVGGGLAGGYGVTSAEQAIDGALADAIHETTGRGVSVVNRATDVRLEEIAASMGAARAHTFDVLIWGPNYREATERLSMRVWRRALSALVADVQATSPTRMILLHMPHVTGPSPVAVLARRWLPRLNRVISEVAASFPRTIAQPVAPVEVPLRGSVVLDRDYYAACAALLLPTVLGESGEARAVS